VKFSNQFRPVDVLAWGAALIVLGSAAFGGAQAATPVPTPTPAPTPEAAFESECGSCHIAFPARLMRPAEWSQVLGTLDRHFGVDASLDPAALSAVAAYLGATPRTASATAGQPAPQLPRITTSDWFRHEHDEVPARVWSSSSVKTASNCSACHAGAERGNFDEDSVRLPK
jgi:nitrate/TMAO reductase-like tetraheme cytochrome c subunit